MPHTVCGQQCRYSTMEGRQRLGATKVNNKRLISRIAANLLARSRESEESSLDISRLRNEIIKDIESKDEIFGKFLGLLETLRDVIPGEEKRYHAAIKILSATSGLSQKDVLKAADTRLTELRKLDEAFMYALADRRDDLKVMESKSLEIRDEISRFREKIGQLEEEEQKILNAMAVRSGEIELAENGIEGLLADIAAEITGVKAKVEESIAERELPQTVRSWDPVKVKNDRLATDGSADARGGDFPEVSASQDTEDRKRCSVCGGQAIWYQTEKIWKCYVCAHEEEENTEMRGIQGNIADPREPAPTQVHEPAPPRATTFAIPPEFSTAQKRSVVRKKACPICKKKMDWREMEKSWRCPYCDYKRMAF